MSECSVNADFYVDIPESMVHSSGTEFCCECGRLIPCGEFHYRVREWDYDDDGRETHLGVFTVCEQCGDLAVSWMDLGYCWNYGGLRKGIKEELKDE